MNQALAAPRCLRGVEAKGGMGGFFKRANRFFHFYTFLYTYSLRGHAQKKSIH